MAKQEYCLLAHKFDPTKHKVVGWLCSEKLDGMRALWDGGISRGMGCRDVPYANTLKHDRYVHEPKATGLWTRLGQPIQAPDWWLDCLPNYPLDGELYAGRGRFQEVMSTCKKLQPVREEWEKIQYHVFDIPMLSNWQPGYSKWIGERVSGTRPNVRCFGDVVEYLHSRDNNNLVVRPISQAGIVSLDWLDEQCIKITETGGEGLIIRDPFSIWKPQRSWNILKVKKFQEGTGIVLGYYWGRETDKGSKLLGKMGSLVVGWGGKVFELSGFTEQERTLRILEGGNPDEGIINPGKKCSDKVTSLYFPLGKSVRFKYRELTWDGLPKEARFWR